jgi:putative transposase
VVEYRTSGHTLWDIKYHIIWIAEYRYKVLRGEVAEHASELIRELSQAREATIVRGAISPDHIHMLVAALPQLSPAKLVQHVKGRFRRGSCSGSSRTYGSGTGGICAHEDTFARRWAR